MLNMLICLTKWSKAREVIQKRRIKHMIYKIREIREEQHISQSELAEKAGISRSILGGLETGREIQTTTKTLLKIADALGVSIKDLFLSQRA